MLREHRVLTGSQTGNPSREIKLERNKTRERPDGNSLELKSTSAEIKSAWAPHQIEEDRRKSLSKLQV